jgi:ABC-2 type transport system ATP-binding protein
MLAPHWRRRLPGDQVTPGRGEADPIVGRKLGGLTPTLDRGGARGSSDRILVNRSTPDIELTARSTPAQARGSDGPVLAVSAVTKRWPRKQTPVLHDIDLALDVGELVWLTGENGAGKTTLLRVVAGIIAPDSGGVRVCGLEASRSRREYQQRIGLLTAGNSGLYARMTVTQNLDYWARLAFVAREERGDRVAESIERFSLGELARRRMDRMSMGQRQRVRIAMTFLHRPSLVLLDEPANSLDDEGCAVLVEAVEEHRRAGGSVVWCSPGIDGPGARVDRRLALVGGALESHD